MHIKCPHCQNPIEVVGAFEPSDIECPSCGSHFELATLETQSYQQTERRLLGRFELLERVGSGHFGDVWRARDTQLDRIVAVKIPRRGQLDGSALASLEREARAAAQVQHANIVSVYEVGAVGDDVFIVSDFVAGFSLAEWLLAHRPTHRLAARWCAAIADGLHALHEAGVVHRDLKPANIMLADRDRGGRPAAESSGGSGSSGASVSTVREIRDEERFTPKITDFGLAKREAGEITITVDGKILGTPAYMSPEQARGEGHGADRRSDVYSLGVVLYELLVGERPFKGQTRLLLHQVLHDDPTPPRRRDRTIPRDLETICLHAIEKAPAKRYATAAEFAVDLRAFLAGEAISVRPPSLAERSVRWIQRNRAVAAIAALGASLMLVGGFAAYAWLRGDPPTVANASPTARTARVEAIPSGATITIISLNSKWEDPVFEKGEHGEWLPAAQGESPVEASLEPGKYLMVAEWPDKSFHEVFRYVPRSDETPRSQFWHLSSSIDDDGAVVLPAIRQPDEDVNASMAFFAGAERFLTGETGANAPQPHERTIQPFYLDRIEASAADYQAVINQRPPASANGGADAPMTQVSYHEAVAYCERAGKRLPDEFEFEFAATNGGASRFPWGDPEEHLATWSLDLDRRAAYDVTPAPTAVQGLYSGVVEWTIGLPRFYPPFESLEVEVHELLLQTRIVRGGPMSVADGQIEPTDQHRKQWLAGPRQREGRIAELRGQGLGFRGARSARPRTRPVDFGRAIAVKAE